MYNTTTSKLTQIFRAGRLILHIISGLVQSALYPHLSQPAQKRMAKKWSVGLLAILSVRLRLIGALPVAKDRPVMLVANHVSWLDVYSLITVCPSRFVAKSEIRNWPLLGWLIYKCEPVLAISAFVGTPAGMFAGHCFVFHCQGIHKLIWIAAS